MNDVEFAERAAKLVARSKRERAAERLLLSECTSAIEALVASGEPLSVTS